ncbi:hypothetical protein JW979_13550, partial [bacterium]|nr:hypothetical protein [candidate division CSSED10-310 bacterium]
TFIILGPKQRVHVYSDMGVHITSLILRGDQVKHRLNRKRWRYASESEFTHFRTWFRAHFTKTDQDIS